MYNSLSEKLEIFIITFNRASKLDATLSRILADDSPVKNFRINVIDNNSTDKTFEVVSRYLSLHNNLYYEKNKYNIGGNANIVSAFYKAEREYVWILADNDDYCWDNWNEVEQYINDKSDAVVVATYECPKYDIAQLYNQMTFLPGVIYKTSNIDDTVIGNMEFNIADGNVKTKGSFDISSYLFDVFSTVNNCDANLLSKNFLGLENQIFGKVNAKISLKGKIPENAQDIKLVSGKVNFSVNNGKMPKLGSLEYLLRAGNLFKSGIMGLTLNNLIEVLTPYKTGEFSAIKGSFDVHSGKISSLEIFSKGNNLSLFIYGGYDIINDNADIEILGRLSKNVSNVLGAAGNASLNTLFNTLTGNKIKEGSKSQIIENVNKVPLIEISGDDYRLFLAKIKGRLNSDDYVKSFNWLN